MQPNGKIPVQPWMTAPETARVLAALAKGGIAARFVGGSVRNALLGVAIDDIDLAVACKPEDTLRLLIGAGIRAISTGIEHGTITAVSNGKHFEITSLRRDAETFGRKARVEFTDDWLEDAQRRDFTVNAMFADADGALYDFFDGRADLAAGRIRFVGMSAERIKEDVLRILRFFRFQAWYGKEPLHQESFAACVAAAPSMSKLSGERVQKEMRRLLEATDPVPTLRLMADNKILAHWLPELGALDTLTALVALERERGEADPWRRLAALLPPDSDVAALAERWRLSNAVSERLQAMVVAEPTIQAQATLQQRRQWRYRLGDTLYADRVLLAWAKAAPSNAAASNYGVALQLARDWPAPNFPLSGADVVALGVAPGPQIGALLRAVEAWWIDGDFSANRAACLAEMRRRAAELSS
ncbi:MAG: CCA tRNA nucleotidyltransferase [Rhodospirillales bacterium]